MLEETSADFTNTFRILAHISRDPSDSAGDEQVIKTIVEKYCAPVDHLISKKKSKYSAESLLKLKDILENRPEVLALFGMDVETARRELAALD